MRILTCTEASIILGTDKKAVYDMVKEGKLKNKGDKYRFMVLETEILKMKKQGEK